MSATPSSHSLEHEASCVQAVVSDECRLKALRRYDILDTEPEPAFDRITDLAADLFDAPVAIINLIAEERQWFKSAVGFGEQETGLDVSFCVYTVAEEEVFVVEDLAADERFADNPYVVEDGIRFYAGAPLTTPDGEQIGTMCILDTEPRSPSEADRERLADLAAMVVDELELRREHAERKETAEKLSRSRELLRQAEEVAQVGGWEYDVRTETLSWTDETYRIHDLPLGQEIEMEEALSFYVPDARPTVRSHLRDLIQSGGTHDLEVQIVTAKGDRRWVRVIGEAHQVNGETVRVNGAIQDVTARHRAEEELRTQNEVLQAIFDNIPVVITLFDADGEVLLVNAEFEDTLGWSREDIERQPDAMEQLFPPLSVRRKAFEEIEAATGEWREFQVQARDNTLKEMMGAIVALTDGRRIGIGVDVTEKKERQKQLRLLEAAVQHTCLPILITEAEPLDAPGPTVVYANPAASDVSGYPLSELQGQSPRTLQGPDTDRDALDRIREALEAGEPIREVVRNYTKDGTMYWNDIYIAPVRDEVGEVTHFVSVQDDVTEEIRRREELRKAKEAAEEADRIKSALLTNMNHEFRTPLTSIISFSQIIAGQPALAENFADKILGGGKRLLRTLNAVMDFAELEGGRAAGTPQLLDVGDVAASVVDAFEDQAARKDLSLTVERPNGAVTAHLDEHCVERVLTHLVSNAIKFTEEGGVTVQVRDREEGGEVTVADTGIGISPADQSKVFNEFYQASAGNDRTHEGNGLGLTIAKRMVDQMGGTIELDSTPGEGTRVTVWWPDAKATG